MAATARRMGVRTAPIATAMRRPRRDGGEDLMDTE
jgi:hypothetical protein